MALLSAGEFPSGSTVVQNIALLTADQTPTIAASVEITVDVNTPPNVEAIADQLVAEGSTITLTAFAQDADGDPIAYTWDLDGDSLFESPGQAVFFSAVSRDGPDSQAVVVQACDHNNACATAGATITITNAPPIITEVNNSGPIAPGASVSLTVAASDPAGANDPLNYAFDCNDDNTYEVGPQASNMATCAFGSSGSFDVNVRVTDGDGGEDTVTTTVTVRPSIAQAMRDSSLRSGDSNTNEGANLNMVVRSSGHNRALVAFDIAEITPFAADIDTVTLWLYIVDNANNWGNEGRTIDAHRVSEMWQEGDGASLQPGNLTNAQFNPYKNRGDGAGVTWKCAVDSQVHNQQPNCDTTWDGGTFDPVPTASVTIYKDFGGNNNLPPTTKTVGWIQFDVTADVVACLTNNAGECGWLIKKTQEGQEGRVEFATREGGQAIYDALLGESVAPRLEVTYQVSGASVEQVPQIFMPALRR